MMVEVSHSDIPFDSFDGVRGRAIQIHDELVYADAAAFFGMNAMWDSTSHAQHYEGRQDPGFYSETDTVVLVDNTMNKVVISPMGRAIGHYARWIKRGAVRLEATSSDPLVQVTAFRDDAQCRIVLVAINNSSETRTLTVAATNAPLLTGALTGERSTGTDVGAVWQPLIGTTTGTGWSVDVPPHSVTSMAAAIPVAASPDGGNASDGGVTGGGASSGGCCEASTSPRCGGVLGLIVFGMIRRRRR